MERLSVHTYMTLYISLYIEILYLYVKLLLLMVAIIRPVKLQQLPLSLNNQGKSGILSLFLH